jgi:DNA-binding IclR family transcriptional regulator
MDTAEGVQRWWLCEERRAWPLSKVREALAELVRLGLVSEDKGADGQTRYGLAPGRLGRARALLGYLADR